MPLHSDQLREIDGDLSHAAADIGHPHPRPQAGESQEASSTGTIGPMQNSQTIRAGLSRAEYIAIDFDCYFIHRHDKPSNDDGGRCLGVPGDWISEQTRFTVSLRPTCAPWRLMELPNTGTHLYLA
jgi:hypothetical protein